MSFHKNFLRLADDRKSHPDLEACVSTFKRQKQTTQPVNNLIFSAPNNKQKTKNNKQFTSPQAGKQRTAPILPKKITLLNPTQSIS
jgi:hypothetical protein